MEDIKCEFGESVPQTEESNARHQWISVAAYYKAQARDFVPGLELDDWLAAETNYKEMLIASYLSVVEEDGAITISGLRQLAKAIGVPNPEHLNEKANLIRAIQDICQTRPCFQINPNDCCNEVTGCPWKMECKKLIAVWKR